MVNRNELLEDKAFPTQLYGDPQAMRLEIQRFIPLYNIIKNQGNLPM